jgi:hypothetical protein
MSNKMGRNHSMDRANKLRRKICPDCRQAFKEWASPVCTDCKNKPKTIVGKIKKALGGGGGGKSVDKSS